MLLADLPPELIATISHHLSTREALIFAASNRFIYSILNDRILDRHIRTDADGYRPLWWACHQSTRAALRTAERALSLGAEVDAPIPVQTNDRSISQPKGHTPLARAIEYGATPMVALLLRYGADPCVQTPPSSPARIGIQTLPSSPMMMAVEKGNLEILKALVSVADERYDPTSKTSKSEVSRRVNSRVDTANTCLHRALSPCRLEVVQLLLDHGAFVNAKNGDGQTPLSLAATLGSVELVDILLKAGADPYMPDKYGRDSLARCVENAHRRAEAVSDERMLGHREVLRHLLTLRSGSGPKSALEKERSRARTWRYVSQERMFEMLTHEHTSLVTIQILIEFGINVDARSTEYGVTALVDHARPRNRGEADSRLRTDVIRLLLDAGADINARHAHNQRTALMMAMESKNERLVQLLLERGADSSVRSLSGQTAFGEEGPDHARLVLQPTRREDHEHNEVSRALLQNLFR